MKKNISEKIIGQLLSNEEFSLSLSTRPNLLGPIFENAIALLLKALSQQQARPTRIWFTHHDPRTREKVAADCHFWLLNHHLYQQASSSTDLHELDDPENSASRMRIIQHTSSPFTEEKSEVIILSPESLEELIASANSLEENSLTITVSEEIQMNDFFSSLEENHYVKVPQIDSRGQWAQRGGIIDVFGWQELHPLRIELFDTTIESLREFDIHTQTSRRKIKSKKLLLNDPKDTSAKVKFKDFIRTEDILISAGESAHKNAQLHFSTGPREGTNKEADFSTACEPSPLPPFYAGDFVMKENQRNLFTQQIQSWKKEKYQTYLFFASQGEKSRFDEILGEDFCKKNKIISTEGNLSAGLFIPSAKLNLISASQLFGRAAIRSRANSALHHQRRAQAQTDLEDIRPGDLIVHAEYGIGRFKAIALDSNGLEEIHLRFRDSVILSVPIDHSHLVSRYVGMGGKTPDLSKIGDGKWSKSKKNAESAIFDYAAQLLKIQAERQERKGCPHPADGKWMQEFESSFPYRETPGQVDAINDAKADMESNKPMDRLICGDVGFGKTEIAIRATFKAVTGGKQVAILVPTTILAEQHWRNFKERMSHFPIRIELLNRFRKPSEVRSTLEGLANGSVDIVIGTHRLVSDDVHFKNLGLAIVDEEQRFGVKHKEKFKQRFNQVDVLTLSATPIPRTLYLSLMGARDMSTIDTPPPNKVPVKTSICGYDENIILEAIQREMKRGGQVFFLHNRVQTIELIRDNLLKLVPNANIVIGHGQMEKAQLEKVMTSFVEGKADILLSTTIIESGIDIPNANTIIIDRADRFGLADLYQLRGRVGRGGQQAYAILLIPQELMSTDAKRRIQAIQQYTALGSGFKIAMRDLEIRGAGNLLGTKQSGHIAAVGFELYCQLLKQSIERLKGNKPIKKIDVLLRADFLNFHEGIEKKLSIPCYIPTKYMPEARMRIQAYKRLAEAATEADLKLIKTEWKDRYGKLAKPVLNLIETSALKMAAADANISAVEIKNQKIMLTRNQQYIQLEGSKFPRLTESLPAMKLRESLQLLKSI